MLLFKYPDFPTEAKYKNRCKYKKNPSVSFHGLCLYSAFFPANLARIRGLIPPASRIFIAWGPSFSQG